MAHRVTQWARVRRRLSNAVRRTMPSGRRRVPPAGGERALLAEVIDEVSTEAAPVATVGIVDVEGSRSGATWEATLAGIQPGFRAVRLVVPRSPGRSEIDALHLRLAASGPFDLLIDLSRSGRVARVVPELVYALRDGGGLLAVGRVAPAGTAPTPFERFLARELETRSAALRTGAMADSVAVFRPIGRDALVVKRGETLAKISPRDADRLLTLRPSVGRVLAQVPEGVVDVGGLLDASRPAYLDGFPRRCHAPPLSMREYDDVLLDRRQIVVSGHLLLPDTFRHLAQPYPRNDQVTDYSPRWAGPVPAMATRPHARPGAWFYLDGMYRGHFGHALTDILSRSWGWPEAKRRHPALKALVFPNHGRRIADWERQLFAAAGIPPEDQVVVRRPQRVETLVSASQMFSNPDYVHPRLAEIYARIGTVLAAAAPDAERPRRLFCSRRERKRWCENTDEVEAFFAARGFTVIVPEDHSLPEQVALFRQAEIIAGFAGSGMFQLALTGSPRRVIEVTSENYRVSNEALIAAMVGHRISIAVCDAHKPSVSTTRRLARRNFDFTFDPAREGAYVDEVLAS